MTKTEFLEKQKEIRTQMDILRQKEKDLCIEYGKSNTAVEIGMRAKCYDYCGDYRGIGYLAVIKVDRWNGGISYQINKVKKDGTMSMNPCGWYGIERIEPVED